MNKKSVLPWLDKAALLVRNDIVGIWTRLWGGLSRVWILVWDRIFLFYRTSRLALGTLSCLIDWVPQAVYPVGKVARAWNWPLTSIKGHGTEWAELYLHSPCMPLWYVWGQLYCLSSSKSSHKYKFLIKDIKITIIFAAHQNKSLYDMGWGKLSYADGLFHQLRIIKLL